jgi:hypothetical protein
MSVSQKISPELNWNPIVQISTSVFLHVILKQVYLIQLTLLMYLSLKY